MRRWIFAGLVVLQTTATGCAQDTKNLVGGGCDGCELMFKAIPKELSWRTTITGEKEAGTPLVVRGVIYKKDG